MRKRKFTEEQIAMALRQGEAGTPVADICRKLGISQATYFRWKKNNGSFGVPELRELRQLRDENRRHQGSRSARSFFIHLIPVSNLSVTTAKPSAGTVTDFFWFCGAGMGVDLSGTIT